MIDHVSGEVTRIDKDAVVINVGGMGLRIISTRTVTEQAELGMGLLVHTYLAVREDALTLYGFATADERSVFETLININGVGPRMGISILSTLTADHLRNAVLREEPSVLTRVPGVGKKTAEKIVFELKGKLGEAIVPGLSVLNDVDGEVLAALTALGYSIIEAQSAIQSIPKDGPHDVESRIIIALQYFS